tara:strand:- start:6339 stop:6806 length:468 start_codon:yes stop_codon:yes gene_type:complete
MATSTLLQYLQADDGDGVALTGSPSHRRQVERFIASAAIAEGDAVSFDTSKTADSQKTLYVVSADTGAATSKCFIGVALETAAAGDEINVVISGLAIANVAAGNAASAGVPLMISTGGDFINYSAGSVLQNAAISCEALAATTAGKASVIVFKQF